MNNFSPLSGQPFSTKDRDNDNWQGGRCTDYMTAEWWYAENAWDYYWSTNVNPNGMNKQGHINNSYNTMFWYPWPKFYDPMRFITMKITHF